MLADQALTVQAAIGGRLTLGIGLSHQVVIENVFGQSFDRPARHMREYLSILMPLLLGEQVAFTGETLKAATFGPLEDQRPRASRPGGRSRPDHAGLGRSTCVGNGHLDDRSIDHRVPCRARDPRAAAEAGRGEPRVAVGLPVCVTERRRRVPDRRPQRSSPSTAAFRPIGPCWIARERRARPMWPSWVPRTRFPPRSAGWPTSGPPTCRCALRDGRRDQRFRRHPGRAGCSLSRSWRPFSRDRRHRPTVVTSPVNRPGLPQSSRRLPQDPVTSERPYRCACSIGRSGCA